MVHFRILRCRARQHLYKPASRHRLSTATLADANFLPSPGRDNRDSSTCTSRIHPIELPSFAAFFRAHPLSPSLAILGINGMKFRVCCAPSTRAPNLAEYRDNYARHFYNFWGAHIIPGIARNDRAFANCAYIFHALVWDACRRVNLTILFTRVFFDVY